MTPFKTSALATVLLAGLSTITATHAQDLPLWEIGAGVGALTLPDYRGSDSTRAFLVPVPYFVYRGEFLKADRNGVRGTLFDSGRVVVDLSLNATLPVRSKDIEARRGMSDLRPTVELGPTVEVTLWGSQEKQMKLDFRAPVRAAVTVESKPKHIGWVASPNLNLDMRDPFGLKGWNLGMHTGPVFQSKEYNAYFYSVGATDAITGRPAYDARGGYAGSQFTIATSKRYDRYWVGGFVRYDNLHGAVFDDSPLVKRRDNVSAGIAVSWVFGQSKTMVKSSD